MTLVTCAVAETLKPRLPELLQRVLDWRVQEGFNKYGQTLADNADTLPEQLVHVAQELLDVAMYGTWIQRRPDLPMQMHVAVGVWTTMAVRFLTQLLDLAPELTFEDLIRKEGHSGVPAAIQTVRELERVILGAYPVTLCYVGPVQALHLLLREREQAQARVRELEAQLATLTR